MFMRFTLVRSNLHQDVKAPVWFNKTTPEEREEFVETGCAECHRLRTRPGLPCRCPTRRTQSPLHPEQASQSDATSSLAVFLFRKEPRSIPGQAGSFHLTDDDTSTQKRHPNLSLPSTCNIDADSRISSSRCQLCSPSFHPLASTIQGIPRPWRRFRAAGARS